MLEAFSTTTLGEIADIQMGQSPDSQYVQEGLNNGFPFLQGNAEFGDTHPQPKFSCSNAPRICNDKDVLISVRAPVGEVNIANARYCIGRGLSAIRFKDMPATLGAKLVSKFSPELQRVSQGTTFAAINKSDLATLTVLVPPNHERGLIAKILDTLDTQILQTEVLIAKLEQIKQGLLTDLLTRGIGANGQLRPTPTQAPQLYKESPLGLIPKEWEAHQLRDLATLITSGSRGWATHYADVGALFVRSQNVRMGFLDFAERQHVAPPPGSEGQRTRLEGCDLLITITGNSVGNVAHVPGDWHEIAFVSQHVGLVRLRDPSLSLLAAHYLVHGAPGNQQLIDAQYGQSKPGLNLENLRDLRVPYPSSEEGAAIVGRIASFYERIETEELYSAQLHELKSGLMDDLLTGRVRVTPLLALATTENA